MGVGVGGLGAEAGVSGASQFLGVCYHLGYHFRLERENQRDREKEGSVIEDIICQSLEPQWMLLHREGI